MIISLAAYIVAFLSVFIMLCRDMVKFGDNRDALKSSAIAVGISLLWPVFGFWFLWEMFNTWLILKKFVKR